MFMWLGYKLGEWLDVWEENHKVHNQQIFLGGNWWLFSGMGALVWDNWKRFMGEQRNPGDSTSFLVPQVDSPVGGWLS